MTITHQHIQKNHCLNLVAESLIKCYDKVSVSEFFGGGYFCGWVFGAVWILRLSWHGGMRELMLYYKRLGEVRW